MNIDRVPITKYTDINVLRADKLETGSYKVYASREITSKNWGTNKLFVDSSSGNHGCGVAYWSDKKNFKARLYMPENTQDEKLAYIRQFPNTDIILTDKNGGSDLAAEMAKQYCQDNGLEYVSQYNAYEGIVGYTDLAKSIIQSIDVSTISHLICGVGTSCFIQGIGRWLKIINPNLKIIGVSVSGINIADGIKNYNTDAIPEIYDSSSIDEWYYVKDEYLFERYNYYAKNFWNVGVSSIMNLLAAQNYAKIDGSSVLTVFPDRYVKEY